MRGSPLNRLVLASIVAVLVLPAMINYATSAFPESWKRYAWVAWPIAVLLAVFVIGRAGGVPTTPAAGIRAADLDAAAGELATVVHRQWTEEATVRALNQPEPIAVSWRVGGDQTDRPPATGAVTTTLDTFLRLDPRRMVVLGGPGAGKTSLAIMLTIELLNRRRNVDLPVPVLVNISAWRPHQRDLVTWLVQRLQEDYPGLVNLDLHGQTIAERLFDSGRLLAVLDGLDEMPAGMHADAIEGINMAAAGGLPFLLTCRYEEYERAVRDGGRLLHGALVVEMEAVTAAAAGRYLSHLPQGPGNRWAPLLAELRTNPSGPVAQALSTPLMVWLLRTVYSGAARDPAELLDTRRFGDPAPIEDHLLDALLPAAYAPRPASRLKPRRRGEFTAASALGWLSFLARHLSDKGVRDLAWWRLEQAVPVRTMAVLAAAPVLLTVAAASLVFQLVPALSHAGTVAVFMAVLLGPSLAAGVALCGPPALPTYMDRPARDRMRWSRLLAGAALGLGAAAITVPAGGPVAAASMATVFLGGGVLLALLQTPKVISVNDPATSHRRDRAAMGTFLGVTTVGGALVGLSAGPGRSYSAGLVLFGGGAIAFGCTMYLIARSRRPRVRRIARSLLGRGSQGAIGLGAVVGGLAGLQLSQWTTQMVTGTAAAVVGGAFCGLTIGLTMAQAGTATSWLLLAQVVLGARGKLPRPLFAFLNDARHRGLLRQVGGYYQFRHARLQDRLLLRNHSVVRDR